MMVFSRPKNVNKQSCVNGKDATSWQKRAAMDLSISDSD
jgi:hypothetical protein